MFFLQIHSTDIDRYVWTLKQSTPIIFDRRLASKKQTRHLLHHILWTGKAILDQSDA